MTPRQLKALYPYMFQGPHIGLAFYRGWMPLFTGLCEDLDAVLAEDKQGFHWTQLKEKYGTARFYWEMSGQAPEVRLDLVHPQGVTSMRVRPGDRLPLAQRISDLVDEAESATESLCIVCGEYGSLNQDRPWMLTLCEHHARQQQRGLLEQAWYGREEES